MAVAVEKLQDSSSDIKTEILEEIRALVPRIRDLASESERARWLAPEILETVGATSVWRTVVPKQFGGFDLPLEDQCEIVSELARADGSLGWVAGLWLANTWIGQLIPDDGQREIFSGGDVRISGALTPTGTIVPTDGGYILNGNWKWNTGVRGSVFDAVASRLEHSDGPPDVYYVFARTSELSLADDWDAFGAMATGSSTTTAKDVFVPAHRVIKINDALAGTTGDRSNAGVGEQRNYGFFAYVSVQQVSVFIGMARAALELFLQRLPGRSITYTPWKDQSASPVTHIQVASAANKIAAADALQRECIQLLQRRADFGEQPSVEEKAELRGRSAYAIELAREAVSILYTASGASVIMRDIPFQRVYRDIQALSNHAAVLLTSNLEVHGRVLVGLDPATPFL
ncbi:MULTISPECIES: acyl-CoA dehydrogenase family protein [unclassified Mycobacterium]|uniref:acyl-CoA dehydrogenase family protein n=1 Tax=unclassified Mycobacterium TaxID=2642494 RepID=UPI0029C817E3|nr:MULTISPECIES: acyl-CoA dehydrogenase family protein [unclassified Mycobacterium]